MSRWPRKWLSEAAGAKRDLWRGVEAQHRVATMRLVDTLREQDLLEQLLEQSKPPLPPQARATDYLLFTPFRYAPDWPSRFRRPDEAGAWYGADDPQTVAAELAYWRWKFVVDSDGLRGMVTDHLASAFQVSESNPIVGLEGRAVGVVGVATRKPHPNEFLREPPPKGSGYLGVILDVRASTPPPPIRRLK